MEILVEFIFTISVQRSRSEYRSMFSGAAKFYSSVVTFMNKELNKTFKRKTQKFTGVWGGCLFVFSWAQIIIPFKSPTFYYP